jgi:hypothetical protein
MPRDRYLRSVTIASGASLSGELNVNALEIVGLMMPAAWTAASITFAAALGDGTTFGKVQNEAGTEKTLTSPAVDTYIHLDTPLRCAGRIKVRSGTASAAVNQAADRTITLVLAPTE